ncbi:MAG: LysM peptidoglycan-binding domain-containing protein [Actinobacteria bacterium]|jgi:LysM repeat protein|nr:LysM peptidoglycan-binding domain-containing protein [Actinomycetota bacterium]NCW46881.1 LysM peptidoglycan-binding domain-containing protein [Actinomycetota bacterium]
MMTIAINPSPLNSQSQLRLTPRGRALARLAVVSSLSILLLAGFSLFSGASAGSSDSVSTTPYMKITVKPGETLWSIAANLSGSGDRRDLVDELIEVNRLKSPELVAGQKIYIPTRG